MRLKSCVFNNFFKMAVPKRKKTHSRACYRNNFSVVKKICFDRKKKLSYSFLLNFNKLIKKSNYIF